MLNEKELSSLSDVYQRRVEEIRAKIATEFPEFDRMDVLYVENFIQEKGIPLEIAIQNLKDAPVEYVNKIKYANKLRDSLFFSDSELETVERLLKNFDKEKVLEFVRRSLNRNTTLWKIIREEEKKFDEDTTKYLSHGVDEMEEKVYSVTAYEGERKTSTQFVIFPDGLFQWVDGDGEFTHVFEGGGPHFADETHKKLSNRIDKWVKKLDLEGLAKDMEVHEEIELHEGLKLVRDY